MTGDGTPMPEDGECDLTVAHLDLYWYFADTVNRKGTVRATRSQAQHDFNMKWAPLVAMMQEIEDAGYWVVGDNGTPKLSTDKIPPKPRRLWIDDSNVGSEGKALTPTHTSRTVPAPGHVCAGTQAISLKELKSRRSPYGGTSLRRHTDGSQTRTDADGTRIIYLSQQQQRLLALKFGAEIRDLVDYFQYKIRKTKGGFAPDEVNAGALGANMKRWLIAGDVDPKAIKIMINLFVAQWNYQRKGVPAWKLFLSQREKLRSQALDQLLDTQRMERSGTVIIKSHMLKVKRGSTTCQ